MSTLFYDYESGLNIVDDVFPLVYLKMPLEGLEFDFVLVPGVTDSGYATPIEKPG